MIYSNHFFFLPSKVNKPSELIAMTTKKMGDDQWHSVSIEKEGNEFTVKFDDR